MEEKSKMLRVCAYARVSTRAEKQDVSLQSQIQYYNDLIDKNPNYINMGVYAEKRTGGNQYHRSEFLQMIQECRNRNIDIIYTKTIARFGRNQLELLRTLEELTNIGVRVIFELEDIDSLRDKQIIRTVIKSYFAEMELETDKRATNFGIQRMFEQGKVHLSNPFPLFGYKYGEDRKLLIEPDNAKIVKEIFDRYCNNERVCEIVKSLNERGIKTASGKQWESDSINRLIKQEKYTGKAFLQKTYCVDGKKVKNLGQKAMYIVDAYCEPIISEAQFEEANKLRKSKARFQRGTGFVPEYDCFKGKIKCGLCGGNYTKLTNGHRIYASGRREKISYQCYKTHKSAMKECRNKVQSRQALEDGFVYAFNKLKGIVTNDKKVPYHNEELNELEIKIKQLLDKEKIFLLMEAREQMTPIFKKEHDNLLNEITSLQERAKEIKRHNSEIKLQDYNSEICKNYLNKYEKLESFEEEAFKAMINDIKVMSKNRILYNFKNGYTAEVEIIDYYARDDEIGEVKVYVSI